MIKYTIISSPNIRALELKKEPDRYMILRRPDMQLITFIELMKITINNQYEFTEKNDYDIWFEILELETD